MIDRSSWILSTAPRADPRVRLFCLPYAGGSAAIYRNWSKCLSPRIEVCAIELPGHGSRIAEPPIRRLDRLVAGLQRAITPLMDRPYALFGHSMGAVIAFELTRSMARESGRGPARLFLSGQRAPHLPSPRPVLHVLPKDEFLSELRRFEGTPEKVFSYPELLELFEPILRADFELLETHRFIDTGPLDCDVSIFGGRDDPEVDVTQLNQWNRYTRADCRVRDYPGNHFFPWSCEDRITQDVQDDLQEE